MANGYLIGLDIGTGGVKGLLVSPGGDVQAQAFADYPLLTPHPGWTEQHAEDWWSATLTVLRSLADSANGGEIIGIGLSGQMHGSVFLDKHGVPLRPALLWNDARTGNECEQIERSVGQRRLREIVGNPALAGWQAPKILWLRNHEASNYKKVCKVLLPKDYVRFRLTDGLATDMSDASGTLLLDLKQRDWSTEILETLDIPRSWLPELYEGPDVCGRLTGDAAKQTGIPVGTPVIAGGGDNAASAIGAGVIKAGTGLLSLGTSGVIFFHSDNALCDPDGAIHACCHAVPEKYHLMGVVLSAGGSLRWVRDALATEEVAAARCMGRDPYELLTQEAESVPPGADDLLFLPYLTGERTPHMDPYARGGWLGLSLAHTKSHLVRSVMEGVGFALKDSLLRITELGIEVEELRVVGGGIRSALWRRILASILEVPLRQLNAEEGASFGAALLAAVGSGVYSTVTEAVLEAVSTSPEAEQPIPEWTDKYQDSYLKYQRLYPSLRDSGLFPTSNGG